ncbi:hypothetical protein P7B02_18290 [Caulobacter segnis]|uniref:hypothetical protein n=1 Tax=Caulobacter segnis TaxID=88688 RepID=UPI00240F6C22|nr:hypothetical protein [Caulobacter segnis]MDG2523483.1 hypothetical protein [Caulobacter segnis]
MRKIIAIGLLAATAVASSAHAEAGWICQIQSKSGRNPTYAESLYKYAIIGDRLQLIEDGVEQVRTVQTSYRIVENDVRALTAINPTASMSEVSIEGLTAPNATRASLAEIVTLNKRTGVLTRAMIISDTTDLQAQRGSCRSY